MKISILPMGSPTATSNAMLIAAAADDGVEWPLYGQDAIGGWLLRAKSGRKGATLRTGQIDPLVPFKIRPINGREARESGLRLKGVGCARSGRPQSETPNE
jgi:hypothetical protein